MKTHQTFRIRTSLKAGGLGLNANERALVVKSTIKAGGVLVEDRNGGALKVRTELKAGGGGTNANERALGVKSTIKAGGIIVDERSAAALKVRTELKAGGIIIDD